MLVKVYYYSDYQRYRKWSERGMDRLSAVREVSVFTQVFAPGFK